jgi:hypothetical protein
LSTCISETAHEDNLKIGLWIIGGIFTFLVLEKIFQDAESDDEPECETKEVINICFFTKSRTALIIYT